MRLFLNHEEQGTSGPGWGTINTREYAPNGPARSY